MSEHGGCNLAMLLIAGMHLCSVGDKVASSKQKVHVDSEEESAEDVAEQRWARAR